MKRSTKVAIRIDLRGKIALVVGGTGSIGEEIANGLFHTGAEVIVASRFEHTLSQELRNLIERRDRVNFLEVDVKNEKSVHTLSQKVLSRFSKIDILILSHGVQLRKPFYELTIKEWRTVIDNNLTGTFLACKYLTRSMIQRHYGKVIGITSLTSEFGIRNISAYAASKGGMSQFLKTVAVELSNYNINVNMIAPGRIQTRMTMDIMQNKNVIDSNLSRIPMGRFGLPSDLTGAVLFLASDDVNYITGHTLVIDGGWLASGGNPVD